MIAFFYEACLSGDDVARVVRAGTKQLQYSYIDRAGSKGNRKEARRKRDERSEIISGSSEMMRAAPREAAILQPPGLLCTPFNHDGGYKAILPVHIRTGMKLL
jgi:hypothetical protein